MGSKQKPSRNAPEQSPARLARPGDGLVDVVFAQSWRHNGKDYIAGDVDRVNPKAREQLVAAGAVTGR